MSRRYIIGRITLLDVVWLSRQGGQGGWIIPKARCPIILQKLKMLDPVDTGKIIVLLSGRSCSLIQPFAPPRSLGQKDCLRLFHFTKVTNFMEVIPS